MPFILNSEGIKAYGCFNRQAIEEVYMNKINKNRNLGVDILHNDIHSTSDNSYPVQSDYTENSPCIGI